jgi:hypothetical protein
MDPVWKPPAEDILDKQNDSINDEDYDEDFQEKTDAQDAISDVLQENSNDDDDEVSKECEDGELNFYEQLEEIKCHNEKARIPIAKFVSHCFVC